MSTGVLIIIALRKSSSQTFSRITKQGACKGFFLPVVLVLNLKHQNLVWTKHLARPLQVFLDRLYTDVVERDNLGHTRSFHNQGFINNYKNCEEGMIVPDTVHSSIAPQLA